MPLKTSHEELPALNLTPMIDVVFLLIIFFMVGTKFAEEERKIDVRVPSVGQAAPSLTAAKKQVVSVLRDGTVLLEDRPMTVPQLTNELRMIRQANAAISVTIRGDAEGSFQNVAAVLSACRSAGVRDMSISVRLARK